MTYRPTYVKDPQPNRFALDPNLEQYFRELASCPPLKHEEVLALGKVMREDPKSPAGIAARERLITSNLRLVIRVASTYAGWGVADFADLIQEGNIGLMRAIDMFDFSKGHRISTYAVWWISHHILRYLMLKSTVVHIPYRVSNKIQKYKSIVRDMRQELSRQPTREEVAERMGLDAHQLTSLLQFDTSTCPTETVMIDEKTRQEDILIGNGDQGTSIAITFTTEDELIIDRLVQTDEADYYLNSLSSRAAVILRMYFGIGSPEHAMPEIGRIFGVSRQYIEIELNGAIRRIQSAVFLRKKIRRRNRVADWFGRQCGRCERGGIGERIFCSATCARLWWAATRKERA